MQRIKSYKAETGRDMGNYQEQIKACCGPFANPFSYYEALIDDLLQIENLGILPLYELCASDATGTRIVGLRHDIDADPFTALRAARVLAQRGICGSFYLLHTSPYYGDFLDGVFVRNPHVVDWVRAFIVAGCELGVHNDVFGVCKDHERDGADALCQEIAWLRSQGARILGTTAHNSAPVHGAENSEVFKERLLWARKAELPNGALLPLGELSESEMGLAYEGTFTIPKKRADPERINAFLTDHKEMDIRSEAWMRRYLVDNPLCDWSIDLQIWLLGRDIWTAAGRLDGKEVFEWEINLDRVVSMIRETPMGTRSVIVLHPCYISG